MRTMRWIVMLAWVWGCGLMQTGMGEESGAAHGPEIAHGEERETDHHEGPEAHEDSAADGEHAAHEEHEDHADHEPPAAADAHAGHDHAAHGGEEEGLQLTAAQRERFGIVLATAGPGSLHSEVRLPGQVVFNQDRVVHVVPRVSGIARDVRKSLGDAVAAGELLAVIDSAELADAKSDCLAWRARAELARKALAREQALRAREVSSEQDLLEAGQTQAEAMISLRAAEQKLYALGLDDAAVGRLPEEPASAMTHYEIRAPIQGVITAKHLSLGEGVDASADIFTIVDLSRVWVNLTVYTRDLARVRAGQAVVVRSDHSGAQARGTIAMTTPFVEETSRSATARVVLDNDDGRWVPGTFVSGVVESSPATLPVVVPRQAVQRIGEEDVVFVEHGGAFELAPVKTGRSDSDRIEIVDGLAPGTRYVAEGAFQMKATVITSNLDPHAGHGH